MKKRIAVVAAAVGLLLPLSAAPAQADPIDELNDLIHNAGCTFTYVTTVATAAPGKPQVSQGPNGEIIVTVQPGDPEAMKQASEDYAACVV